MQLRDQVTNFINKFAGKSITPESIKAFYQGLVDELDVNVHPDDDFNSYVEQGTDEQTFKPYEAEMLNKIAEAMFEYCDRQNLDIYSLAMPEHMKQMMGNDLNEAFNPNNIEAVETLFETDLLDAVENHFNLDDTNQVFQSSELHNDGDFIIASDSKSIYLEIVVSEESYSVMNYEELGRWFAEFCDHNGLSGQNSEVLTGEDSPTVTFLLSVNLKSKFGMRESERHIYEAPKKGVIILKENNVRTSPNDAIKALTPFLLIAEHAKNLGVVAAIMDGPLKNPQAYDNEVYFSIELTDGTTDMIEYEFISGTIVLHQDLNGPNPSDDDISLEQFKDYLQISGI